MNVLLVEDNSGDVFLIKEAAKQAFEDLDITVASDGREAARILNKEVLIPDLVILDINLPYKNGMEILKEMKDSAMYKSVPVVMFTSSSDVNDREKALKLGAKDYVVKPIELDDYFVTVNSIFSMAC